MLKTKSCVMLINEGKKLSILLKMNFCKNKKGDIYKKKLTKNKHTSFCRFSS